MEMIFHYGAVVSGGCFFLLKAWQLVLSWCAGFQNIQTLSWLRDGTWSLVAFLLWFCLYLTMNLLSMGVSANFLQLISQHCFIHPSLGVLSAMVYSSIMQQEVALQSSAPSPF
uniref:Uncharacterized protein n=1 Tax=Opuntia streptacantha TaxID=393608 RepID=A0A7C9ADN8_OPUST